MPEGKDRRQRLREALQLLLRMVGRYPGVDALQEARPWPVCSETPHRRGRQGVVKLALLGRRDAQGRLNQAAQAHAVAGALGARRLGQWAPSGI